jgi:malonate transporter and related proteins
MLEVVNLALPFFGLIFLGLGCGKFKAIPETGLAWMDFFILYVALPALFYRIVAQTPLEHLANPRFIVAAMLTTACAFALSFAIGMLIRRGAMAEATIAGLAGGYGNIGYMGPGLALATLGAEATAPVALIFCFDSILLFSLVPFLMTLAGTDKKGFAADALDVAKRIVLHPLMLATMLGALSAAMHYEPPVALDRLMAFLQSAAAPTALFTLGVTVALRPLQKMPWEVPFAIAIKLVVQPLLALTLMSLLGPFAEVWVYTAVLMAALPPALNVFVFARQYNVWVEQASSAVLLGTLLSVATLTTVMWLVKTQQLPLMLLR